MPQVKEENVDMPLHTRPRKPRQPRFPHGIVIHGLGVLEYEGVVRHERDMNDKNATRTRHERDMNDKKCVKGWGDATLFTPSQRETLFKQPRAAGSPHDTRQVRLVCLARNPLPTWDINHNDSMGPHPPTKDI